MSVEEANANLNMKRNLLLCFDAFGTLFRPHSPIFEQYGSVARRLGVKVSDDEVAKSFKTGEYLEVCLQLNKEGYIGNGTGLMMSSIQGSITSTSKLWESD